MLNKKSKNLLVALMGNRVTFLSRLALIAGTALAVDSQSQTTTDLSPPGNFHTYYVVSKPKYETLEPLFWGGYLCLVGLCGEALTLAGRGTKSTYEKTKRHIERRGRLEERFAAQLIKNSESGSTVGYCQNQGMYLAAREADQLDAFYKAKRKLSHNKIPNF